jgi:hypothetical protein
MIYFLDGFPQVANPISATVKMYQGRPTIHIDDKPEYAMITDGCSRRSMDMGGIAEI